MEEREIDPTTLDPRPTTYVFCWECTPGGQSGAGSFPTPTGASEIILRLPEAVCSQPATKAHFKSRKRYRPSWTPAPPSSMNAAAEDPIHDNPRSPKNSRDVVGDGDYAGLASTKGPSHDASTCSAKVGRETGDEQQQQQQQYHHESPPGEAGHDGAEDIRPRSSQLLEHQPVRVVVHEVLSEDFGLFTWPSAIVLACLVWARREEFRGAGVVEIGAGTALPGLLAAKLGAHVILTDRGEAPWVLQNIGGAVAANGLPSACAHTAIPVSPPAPMEGVGGTDEDGGHIEEVESVSGTEKETYYGRGGLRYTDNAPGRGHSAHGNCCVHELSWGEVTPAAIELAKAHPSPQFILGADVFYSSEHFDDVLATVYMLLNAADAANSSASQERHTSSKDQVTGRDAAAAAYDEHVPVSFETTHAAAASGVTSDGELESKLTFEPHSRATMAGGDTRSRAREGGRHSGSLHSVFLTAYHERSARRSLRPLLRKWGMEARVLRDAPRRVLPDDLWEDDRYDSIALIEISLKGTHP